VTNLVVGTAGHIDHGKTWLVRALTGKDTDRLPEEQRRGISIDLGYAPFELGDGRRFSLVDVPGHERFVRAMVAGATGIDLFLLVIDAAEGARPQTHEHLAILRLLGVEHGVVAVTKADAVDAETLELALEEARELVPAAQAVAVSAKTGEGLDGLRAAIGRAAHDVGRDPIARPVRLYVDRVFTLRGIGTVVTGTLWSGAIAAGDTLRLEPGGRDIRVRSVQVHDQPVERAEAGQRVALSLPGVERQELGRGSALIAPGGYPTSYRLDVTLEELSPIEDGARVTLHHGTAHIPARVARIGPRFAQLRLALPVVAARGDHLVLRRGTTVGGGVVLDPAPPRHRDAARLDLVERGEIAATIHAPVHLAGLRHVLDREPEGVVRAGEWVCSQAWLEQLRAELRARIGRADPLDPGTPLPSEPWAAAVVPLLGLERRGSLLYEPGAVADLGSRTAEVEALVRQLATSGVGAVKMDDAELARFLETRGVLRRLGGGHVIGSGGYEVALDLLLAECDRAGEITLARFRDLAGVGRRDAQLLLERFDADGITRREGERRVLRRGARQAAGFGSVASSTESGSTPRTTAS
jgi:selenocysteine-specific elongation factor